MTAQWLLQSNHPNLSTIVEMERILKEQGCDVHLAPLKPRSVELPDLGMLDAARPVVCYGPSFVPRAFGHPTLSPGIFFDPETFRWSAFQRAWGDLMISSEAVVVRADEALSMIGQRSMFVRPDEDSKAFEGGVFDKGSLQSVLEAGLDKGHIAADTTVMLAPTLGIDAEWRTFIVGGDVVAGSSYRVDGAGNVDFFIPHDVIEMAFEAAASWTPADVFCLDIARSGSRYGIVEANCFNASRFYGADASAILAAVSEFSSSIANDDRTVRQP